ncbi:unnamed protein product, partial [Prunus brigantina]
MELLIIFLKYLEGIEMKKRKKKGKDIYYISPLSFLLYFPLSLFTHSLSFLIFFPLSLSSRLPLSLFFFPSLFFYSFSFFLSSSFLSSLSVCSISLPSLSFFLLQLPPPKLLLLLHGVTSMAAKGKNQSLLSAMGSSDPIDPMVDPPL